MNRFSRISQKVFFTSIAIPLFGIYMLTIGCAVDDFFMRCCGTYSTSQIAQYTGSHEHDDAHSHSHHQNTNQDSHDHSTDHSDQHGHEHKNDDCCSDITTSFFNIFQGQPKELFLKGPLKVKLGLFKSVLNDVERKLSFLQPRIYAWQIPPPGQIPTGPLLRIFLQSFLN